MSRQRGRSPNTSKGWRCAQEYRGNAMRLVQLVIVYLVVVGTFGRCHLDGVSWVLVHQPTAEMRPVRYPKNILVTHNAVKRPVSSALVESLVHKVEKWLGSEWWYWTKHCDREIVVTSGIQDPQPIDGS